MDVSEKIEDVYRFVIKIEYGKDVIIMRNWCEDRFGIPGDNWWPIISRDIYAYVMRYTAPHEFYFKNESDATLFQLTWG